LSYTPAKGTEKLRNVRQPVKIWFGLFSVDLKSGTEGNRGKIKSGQQTPRRWGWGTPLKKRAATRMR